VAENHLETIRLANEKEIIYNNATAGASSVNLTVVRNGIQNITFKGSFQFVYPGNQ